ncbi:MAG: sporulation initiation factor Spo0A C-terminal domain-containing protein [Eubacteriales bacterium]|nr:sporulation initiation factor Spo0A C-terminal domain-containing protein [Eubacteriales bacterium]MDD3881695.1 sporulation initiation factor Spo0A C-terminal domain-containing protein [Eubacteriales bacterium]MDD4512246.1 sporulation initiation factor Spo0A C-terminal domain-containing protein [Eubacteriales bacterium]
MRLGNVLALPNNPAAGIKICIAAESAGAQHALCAFSFAEARDILMQNIIDAVIIDEYSPAGAGLHILKCIPDFPLRQFPYTVLCSFPSKVAELCDISAVSSDVSGIAAALSSLPRLEIPKCALKAHGASRAQTALALDSCGFAHRQSGYAYLREAVSRLCVRAGEANELGRTIYPYAAKLFGASATGVERCIRHSIEWAFTYGNAADLYKLLGDAVPEGDGKPSNGLMIRLLSGRIRALSANAFLQD